MADDEDNEYKIARRELEAAMDALRALRGRAPIYGAEKKPGGVSPGVDALSELEDRTLALCEGEYVEFPLAIEVLESWFDRAIPAGELRSVFERLAKRGLIECRIGDSWTFGNVVPERPAIQRTKFRATQEGEQYLKESGGQKA